MVVLSLIHICDAAPRKSVVEETVSEEVSLVEDAEGDAAADADAAAVAEASGDTADADADATAALTGKEA